MTITSLRAVGSAGERVSIALDRKSAGQIDALVASDLGLARGDTLTEAVVEPLIAAIDRSAAQKRALRLINTRDRSTGELRQRLRQAGHKAASIDATLDALALAGLLNDESLAERLASSLADRGNAGRRLIELKLAQKGLSRPLATRAASEATAERDALADATNLVERRAQRSSPRLTNQALYRRLSGFLARRGFDPGVIREAVAAALSGRPEPEPDPEQNEDPDSAES